MPPKVCYIRRSPDPGERPLAKLRKWWRMPQQQDAFFEQSLARGCAVTKVATPRFLRLGQRARARFDAVVVNAKALGEWQDPQAVRTMLRSFPGKRALFLGSANPAHMPQDEVIDAFDVVFKREPYWDLDRYALTSANREKIRPTLAGCPFGGPEAGPGFSDPHDKDYDVYFAGRVNDANDVREQVWARIVASGLDYLGGLQARPRAEADVPAHLQGPRIKGQGYVDAIRRARVNLALDGYGPVTARHLELWQSKSFMLSGPSLREIWLHETPIEGQAYASFDTYDELVDTIRHYLARPEARREIALAGGAFFARLYDPEEHGRTLGRYLNL